jgi:hypothetical protein
MLAGMSNDFLPTKKYPALTDERLSLIADALQDVRNKALSLYDPLNGDGPWGLGTRVYERSCFRIKRLTEEHVWLTVVEEEPKPRFTFAIEGLPIRFYKGSPDDPPSNYLVTTYGELLQRQLFQDFRPLDKILRIAIETDREGRVSSAKLVELDEAGEATGVYVIPFGAARPNVVPLESKAVHLEPITVEPIAKDAPQTEKKTKAK